MQYSQSAITHSKLTKETLEQVVNMLKVNNKEQVNTGWVIYS